MEAKKADLEAMRIVCHCDGETERVMAEWRGFPVRAWRCVACGEEMLHPADAQRALEMARAMERGELRVKVRKIGKSLILTIPKRLAEAYGVEEGETAEWGVEADDRFIVRIAG